MSHSLDSLNRAYVKIYYVTPQGPGSQEIPRDCKQVFFTESPRLYPPDGALTLGIDFLGAVLTTDGAGGVLLLLQITQYIKWQRSFISVSGKAVQLWEQIFVSIPMVFKLEGPRMALMALSPLKVKLIGYAGVIGKAFRAIDEVEKVFKLLLSVQERKGWCSDDVTRLVDGLQALEVEYDNQLQQARLMAGGVSYASMMNPKPYGTGRFAGARFA
jgi:hypothetical protein